MLLREKLIGAVWSSIGYDLRVDGPNNKCSFKVLDIKNQDNNYDCGLMLCLLIWGFGVVGVGVWVS
jgi:hypothetical protein